MKMTLKQFKQMIREEIMHSMPQSPMTKNVNVKMIIKEENPTMPVVAALYEAQPADDESMGDPKIKKLKEAVLRDLREVARYVK